MATINKRSHCTLGAGTMGALRMEIIAITPSSETSVTVPTTLKRVYFAQATPITSTETIIPPVVNMAAYLSEGVINTETAGGVTFKFPASSSTPHQIVLMGL